MGESQRRRKHKQTKQTICLSKCEDKQNIELRYQPEDPSHLNNKGHLNLAKKLLRHIKELDWK